MKAVAIGWLAAAVAMPLPGDASQAARARPNEVLHSPWLAIRLEQDGRPVRLDRRDLRTVDAELGARPFRIRFPKRDPEVAYQLCAWTDKSVFEEVFPRAGGSGPNAGSEHPCFLPGTGMADTEAGSGMLMLDNRGHNYLIDLRLGPDPERPSVFYSSLWRRGKGSIPIAKARRPVYVVAFHDSDRDGHLDNDEFDFLVLRFGR